MLKTTLRGLLTASVAWTSCFGGEGFEEALFFMDIPVVTASRQEESIRTAPAIISVVERSEIDNMGARTLADVVNLVPGFEGHTGLSYGVHDNVGVRGGLSELNDGLLLLMDGQRMNDSYTGGGLTYIKSIPLHNVKRVEFIRGPGSSLYGSNAFVGVVNVITERGDNLETSSVEVAGGALGALRGSARLFRTIGDTHLGATFRWDSDKGDTYKFKSGIFRIPGDNLTIKDPVDQSYDAGVRFTRKGLKMEADYVNREREGFMPEGFLDKPAPASLLDTTQDDTRHFRAHAVYDWSLGDHWSVTPSLSYKKGRVREIFCLASPAFAAASFLAGTSAQTDGWFGGPGHDVEDYGVETLVNLSAGRHKAVAGVSYLREDVTYAANVFNVNFFTASGIPADTPGKITTYSGADGYSELLGRDILGIFVSDNWEMTDWLKASVGLRYDEYSDFGNSYNPRAALVIQASQKSNVKILYGSAFRAPSFFEQYVRNNPVVLGNPTLSPAQVRTYELSYNYFPAPNIMSSLTAYRNDYRNLIDFTGPIPQTAVNLSGKEKDLGGEAEIQIRHTRNRYVSASYAHIRPENSNGEARPWIARNKVTAAANYDVLPEKLIVNVNGFFQGGRENRTGNSDYDMPDALILNANLRLLGVVPKTELSVGFYNLTDEERKSPSFEAASENVPNRGFEWMAKATYKF